METLSSRRVMVRPVMSEFRVHLDLFQVLQFERGPRPGGQGRLAERREGISRLDHRLKHSQMSSDPLSTDRKEEARNTLITVAVYRRV